MELNQIIIIVAAALLISFIVWWFFGKHKTSQATASMTSGNSQEVNVTVNGGYAPNTVVLKKGVPAKIVFERKDPSSCFNEVMFPDFGVHEKLPVGKPYPIDIDTSKPGEYQYACGMDMFHGKIVIK